MGCGSSSAAAEPLGVVPPASALPAGTQSVNKLNGSTPTTDIVNTIGIGAGTGSGTASINGNRGNLGSLRRPSTGDPTSLIASGLGSNTARRNSLGADSAIKSPMSGKVPATPVSMKINTVGIGDPTGTASMRTPTSARTPLAGSGTAIPSQPMQGSLVRQNSSLARVSTAPPMYSTDPMGIKWCDPAVFSVRMQDCFDYYSRSRSNDNAVLDKKSITQMAIDCLDYFLPALKTEITAKNKKLTGEKLTAAIDAARRRYIPGLANVDNEIECCRLFLTKSLQCSSSTGVSKAHFFLNFPRAHKLLYSWGEITLEREQAVEKWNKAFAERKEKEKNTPSTPTTLTTTDTKDKSNSVSGTGSIKSTMKSKKGHSTHKGKHTKGHKHSSNSTNGPSAAAAAGASGSVGNGSNGGIFAAEFEADTSTTVEEL